MRCPGLKNAELIEGIVYLRFKVPHRGHARPHGHLMKWLGSYVAYAPGVDARNSYHVRLDWDNVPQPDCLLFIQPEHSGQAKIDDEGYVAGAPDLVAEVAASSANYDLHDKLNAYRRNGVREYVVVRVCDQEVDWFVLREGRYDKIAPGEDGVLRSTIFSGLWLDPSALLRGDLATVLAVAQRGLNSPEHAEFAVSLARA
jgi:Uma2 family endonuclease